VRRPIHASGLNVPPTDAVIAVGERRRQLLSWLQKSIDLELGP
jgi:hypothetical protein